MGKLLLAFLLAQYHPTARDRVDVTLSPQGPILFSISSYLQDDALYPPVYHAVGRQKRVLELQWGGCDANTPFMLLTIPDLSARLEHVGFTTFTCRNPLSNRSYSEPVRPATT